MLPQHIRKLKWKQSTPPPCKTGTLLREWKVLWTMESVEQRLENLNKLTITKFNRQIKSALPSVTTYSTEHHQTTQKHSMIPSQSQAFQELPYGTFSPKRIPLLNETPTLITFTLVTSTPHPLINNCYFIIGRRIQQSFFTLYLTYI